MSWISRALDWLRGERYLVLETGYEGIEYVYGVFDRRRALEVALDKKRRAEIRKKADEANEAVSARVWERHYAKVEDKSKHDEAAFEAYKSDPEMIAADEEHLRTLEAIGPFGPTNPDFVCVVTISEAGTKCVCSQLGIGTKKLMLR